MFFIFGWGHTKVDEYGPVQQEKCNHCNNTDIWQLRKINKYFTLFFVPIFPYDTQIFYYCPICQFGFKPEREDFESYKAIAQTNTDCLEGKITEEARLARLDEINKDLQERSKNEALKNQEESKKWEAVAAEKTNDELQKILNNQSGDYNPAFVIAAKAELERRGVEG